MASQWRLAGFLLLTPIAVRTESSMTQMDDIIGVDASDDNQGPKVSRNGPGRSSPSANPSRPEWIVPTVEYLADPPSAAGCAVEIARLP